MIMLSFLTPIINHLWWSWWRRWWWCSSDHDNEDELMIWFFCVGFWLLLLLLLQIVASLPLTGGGHVFCCIRWWCDTRVTGTWRLMCIQKIWRHRRKTWFCTRPSKCPAIWACDGCDGESYPRIIVMVDDGLLSFLPIPIMTPLFLYMHYPCFEYLFMLLFLLVM